MGGVDITDDASCCRLRFSPESSTLLLLLEEEGGELYKKLDGDRRLLFIFCGDCRLLLLGDKNALKSGSNKEDAIFLNSFLLFFFSSVFLFLFL
jgi:hypothetical protein